MTPIHEIGQQSAHDSGDDKRRYERFRNSFLNVSIARAGLRGIFGKKPPAECTNFSRTGLQFDCAKDLSTGEKVLVDVDMEDLSLHELKAEVITKKPVKNHGWCYGVRFCLEETRKADVFHILLMIEDRLKSALERSDEPLDQTAV